MYGAAAHKNGCIFCIIDRSSDILLRIMYVLLRACL